MNQFDPSKAPVLVAPILIRVDDQWSSSSADQVNL